MRISDWSSDVCSSDLVFAEWANHPQGRVAALSVPGGATLSRKQIDDYAAYAGKYGAKGLAWMKVESRGKGRDGINSPIAKFLDDTTLNAVLDAAQANDGDIVLFGAGPYKSVCDRSEEQTSELQTIMR